LLFWLISASLARSHSSRSSKIGRLFCCRTARRIYSIDGRAYVNNAVANDRNNRINLGILGGSLVIVNPFRGIFARAAMREQKIRRHKALPAEEYPRGGPAVSNGYNNYSNTARPLNFLNPYP
jgi:hypothetical protein